jgi:hypothetical protein
MNEREASDLVHRLAAGIQEVPAPVDHLIARSRQMRRRRSLRQVIGAVAATSIAVAGVAVAIRSDAERDQGTAHIAPSDEGDAKQPTAAPGTRLVGLGQVAVEVPEDWVVAENGCARDRGVIFRYPDTRETADLLPSRCPPLPNHRPFASLAIGDVTSEEGRKLASSSWTRDVIVRGLDVRQSGFLHRPPEFCGSGAPIKQLCHLMFWPLMENTFFMLTVHGPAARATVLSIRNSLQVLPKGYTSVPFIKFGSSDAEAAQILHRAGLTAELPDVDFPHYVTGTAPTAGSVVRAGSSVRVIPGDG